MHNYYEAPIFWLHSDFHGPILGSCEIAGDVLEVHFLGMVKRGSCYLGAIHWLSTRNRIYGKRMALGR